MSTLPTTWVETNLGTVVPYGATVRAEPADLTPETWVLELEDVEKDNTKVLQHLTFTDRQSKSTKNRFDAGDVLYGKLRPYLNKVIFAEQSGVCTTEIVPIKPNDAVNGRYLFYWLRHPQFLAYVTDVSHGVNMPRLGTEAGRQAPFVLAPKNEQTRIADKLDTVLTRVDTVNARLARVVPILRRFRQSILAAATSGRLTKDWRSNTGANITDWERIPLSDACTKITDGEHITPALSSEGVPLLSAKDVREWGVDFSETKFVSEESAKILRRRCDPSLGDVLVVSRGTTVGRTCLVMDERLFCLMGSVLLLKPDRTRVLPRFLAIFLASPVGLEQLTSASGATAQAAIYIRDAKSLAVSLASLDEQAEIVRRAETLFAFADRLESCLQTAQTATDRLTPALLAKAFRGELVPQDPNDEPASELLRRLQKESLPTSTKRARKGAA